MALGRDDAQAALRRHEGVLLDPLGAHPVCCSRLSSFIGEAFVRVQRCERHFEIATQHDVGAATRHVGGDRDHLGPTGLRHDVGFTRMLLGVEHLVRQTGLVQQVVDDFGVLDRRRAHQHGLPALVAFANVLDGRFVLFTRGLVDAILLIVALAQSVRRNDDGLKAIDFLKLEGFGVSRARHARELSVKPEIILERDGGQRLVLGLDLHAFLGFHRLVQAIAPATPGHETARELVDDHDFTLLHDVMLVAMVEMARAQRRVDVMQQGDIGRVVERGAIRQQAGFREQVFCPLMAVFCQEDLMRFFVDREIARLGDALARAWIGLAFLTHQLRHDLVDCQIDLGMVFGLPADDQRRACFIDQDRVDLVDDGVVQPALNAILDLVHHVVTEVVEAVFVVGAVRDVATVRLLLLFARDLRQVDTDGQAQEIIEPTHPFGIAACQVIVHRDHMHTFVGQCIEIDRQRRRQGLALTSAHFRNLAVVQCHAAQQLHIEVSHLHDAFGAFPDCGKSFWQQRVERFPGSDPRLELHGFGAQLLVAQGFESGFQRIDLLDRLAILFKNTVVATAEELGQKVGHESRVDWPPGTGTATKIPKIWWMQLGVICTDASAPGQRKRG